jgi:hypothetical protein
VVVSSTKPKLKRLRQLDGGDSDGDGGDGHGSGGRPASIPCNHRAGVPFDKELASQDPITVRAGPGDVRVRWSR